MYDKSDLRSITKIVDAMIKGGANKISCCLTYRGLVHKATLKEAHGFVNDRIEELGGSDIATYEELDRLVASYEELTSKQDELIDEQRDLIANYDKLVTKQQASLDRTLETGQKL